MTESRVEACIDSVMARHPGVSALAQSRYFEAVHQDLAPLARKMEIDLGLANVELERTRNGAKIMERTLEVAKGEIDRLRQELAIAAATISEIIEGKDRLYAALRSKYDDSRTRAKALEDALRPLVKNVDMLSYLSDDALTLDNLRIGDLRRAAALLEKK